MNYQMLYDRLLVRPLGASNRTRGGLVIPDMATDGTPWQKAEVVAVGHGRLMADGRTIPLQVEVGSIVLFFRSQSSGEQLVVPDEEGNDLLVIREPNVLAILRDLPRDTGILTPDGGTYVQ